MSYRIRFQRAGALGCISNLFVEDDATMATQIRHLEAIGYAIIDTLSSETEMQSMELLPAVSSTL